MNSTGSLTSCVVKTDPITAFRHSSTPLGWNRRTPKYQSSISSCISFLYCYQHTLRKKKHPVKTAQRGHTCWFCIKSFLKRCNRAGKPCFDPFHS